MMLTPYQHGIVRVIKESSRFDPADPQFQNYRYAALDLLELIAQRVIKQSKINGDFVAGDRFDEA